MKNPIIRIRRGRRGDHNCLAICLCAGLAGAAYVATGAPVTWAPAGGGSFNDPNNWNPIGVPTVADDAIFPDNAAGTISLSADANPLRLDFRKLTGGLTINAAGNTLTLGSTTAGGAMRLGQAAGQINDITLTGGTFNATHTTAGALVQVGNVAGSHGNRLTVTGPGTIVSSPSTSGTIGAVGVAGSNNNTLSVENGADFTLRGSMAVGVIGANPSTGNLLSLNGGTFSLPGGARGINLRNGTLQLTNGYSDLGFLLANDAGNNTTIQFNSGQLYSRRTQVDNGKDFVIGDGGLIPAIYGIAYSTGTMTIGSAANPADLVLASNGILTGGGAGTVTVAAGGKLRGAAGAKVMPSIINQPVLTTDDRDTGTINFTGLWDNTNLELVMDVGDFPTAANAPTPFIPLDVINVNGAFTHGGLVNFNMVNFVGPVEEAEYRVIGWTSEVGLSSSTLIAFSGGSPLPTRFASDGLYITVPEPVFGGAAVVAAVGLLRRRRMA